MHNADPTLVLSRYQRDVAMLEHDAMLNALRRRDGGMLSAILKTHLKHKREEIESAGFAEE